MVPLHHVVVDDDREGATDDFPVDDRDDLPFGEYLHELAYLFAGPENVLVRIDAGKGLGQLSVILHQEVADLNPVDFVRVGHGGKSCSENDAKIANFTRFCSSGQGFFAAWQRFIPDIRPDCFPGSCQGNITLFTHGCNIASSSLHPEKMKKTGC